MGSYLTNLDGTIVQHIEYVPFGEVFIEERNNTWNSPYLFNGKELDAETGLYYYGARYYNPRESIFLSVDQMVELTMTPYQYTYQNPVRYTNPTGMSAEEGGPGKGGFWRGIGNLFKSNARIQAEDKAGSLKNDPSVRSESVSTRKGTHDSFKSWHVSYTDLDTESATHDLEYSNSGLYAHISFGGNSTEGESTGEGNSLAGSISGPSQGTYFDRWDHQVAMGIGQGGADAALGYVIGRAIGLFRATKFSFRQ